ncbi:MAG TPA: YihY/virulence factor BrkB family protein [Candidatus Limnocylindrales bacterium]|nr:YihY/virulence factor BrkB family protein [Candidatus Limnocylindrales bacterium]
MQGVFKQLRTALWSEPEAEMPVWRRRLVHVGQVLWLAVEGFEGDACSMRASALTLASMLALVPALAASFAYVRGLGWTGQRLESLLLERATILSPEAVSTVVSWVDNISIAGLGLIGALIAIGSAASLLIQMEDAIDAVWGSPHGRSAVRRAADALMLLIFAPLMIAVAASSEAAFRSSAVMVWLESFGGFELLIRMGFSVVWYALVCIAFAALYMFLPAAPVDRRAALIGGIVAGVAWQLAQGFYIAFQFGLQGYNAVYGTLAQLPMLVAWMWTSWVIVLGGAELSAAIQNLAACGRHYIPKLVGVAARERLAISIAIELAQAAHARRAAPTLAELAVILKTPVRSVTEMFCVLAEEGLVHIGGRDQRQCFLSLSPGSIPADRVVAAARGENLLDAGTARPPVLRMLETFQQARRAALGNATLADLVDPVA